MTNFSPGDNAIEKPPPNISQLPDDISIGTLPTAPKEKNRAQKLKEIVVRFNFNNYNDSSLRVAEAHLQILHEWQKQFPTIAIHNNHHQKLRIIDLKSWRPEQHAKEFTIYSTSGKHVKRKSYSVLHRVTSQHSLTKLKDHVESILTQYKCRLTHHFWNKDEYDILKIGHLIGINPLHYSPELAQQILTDSIKLAGLKMAPFRLVFSTPSILTSHFLWMICSI